MIGTELPRGTQRRALGKLLELRDRQPQPSLRVLALLVAAILTVSVAAGLAGVAIVASTVFAMLAGVLLAAGSADPVTPTTGFEWTGLAVGAALLGGTSAFGRRGGIFGTLFSVVLITLFVAYSDEQGWNVSLFAVAAVAMFVGVIATRLVESYGRPRSAGDADGPTDADTPGTYGWTTDRPESWSSTLPVQPTESRSEQWGTDRWGTGAR